MSKRFVAVDDEPEDGSGVKVDLSENPVCVLDIMLRTMAIEQGLELADDYEEQIERWKAFAEAPVSSKL